MRKSESRLGKLVMVVYPRKAPNAIWWPVGDLGYRTDLPGQATREFLVVTVPSTVLDRGLICCGWLVCQGCEEK
jgi:hypothetical protein